MSFEHGTWGGEIRREFAPQPGDVVALEHRCSSGFANTDLDLLLAVATATEVAESLGSAMTVWQ